MGSYPGCSQVIELRPARGSGARASRIPSTSQLRTRVVAIDAAARNAAARSKLRLSAWTRSAAKRRFDVACVLLALPLALPILALAALAVRLTSRGPVLFRQQRVGRFGLPFTIYKLRTMRHRDSAGRGTITTLRNQAFTPVGPFLRRWKIDELPQIANVLRGDMSLVGPRPRVPRCGSAPLPCRPGITGQATLFFAREERALAGIPEPELDSYYDSVVIPLKQCLDEQYMAEATLSSDLRLIVRSVFRRWNEMDAPVALPLKKSEWLPG